ncbi:MAG: cell surface protein SprA [Flavobacteriaceae bacterium]
MVDLKKAHILDIRFLILIVLFLGIGIFKSFGQDPTSDAYELGRLALPDSQNITSYYQYDPDQNLYIFSSTVGDFPVGIPLVLTPKEFETQVLKEQMKVYFKNKVSAISKNTKEANNAQKDLLPELYVNSKFFSSIFGSSKIDVRPQGSIGVDLGVRYQKTDNPGFSPRNRRNFGFDFDQRISLSLLGSIGERLQITANYDTESTFDFQNLVKLQFNPPKVTDLSQYLPKSLQDKANALEGISSNLRDRFDNVQEKVNEIGGSLQQVKGKLQSLKDNANNLQGSVGNYQNKINDFLTKSASEDAILQNIDIGNVNMPLNSSLISGAQSLMGVKAQLKFGRTNITGVFAEQRSQSQSVIAQGGGTLQDFSVYALDYEADRHFFLAHYFRDNYDRFLKTYPYINSPIQITRVEVWITNRSSQTNNIRNIVALQDLGESVIGNTRLGALSPSFFNTGLPNAIPSNEANKLDPENIGSGSFISSGIRDIGTVEQSFGVLNGKVQEGFDYAILESARKLAPTEYSFNPQLGYLSLNQRLSNDEILGVAYQFTFNGQVYQVGEFANGGIAGTSVNTQIDSPVPQVETNNLVVKLLKSSLTDVRQPVWDLMMKNIYNTGAFQLEQEDFRLSILYADPSPINYLTPVDESIWPEELRNSVLLRSLNLDRLNVYNDPEPEGDGFFDYVPGITVDPQYGRIIFPTVEPFGENLFHLLSDQSNIAEDYNNEMTYNANQAKYVFRDLYALTQAAALESTEKNKFQLKGRYKSAGGDGIAIGAFNVPRGSVQVTAGGRVLREGVDYTVNYQIGRVKILDPALQASNIPIQISVENNTFFGQQNKRFSGIDVLHQFNEKLVVGGTLINLSENPLTQKANYGTEPVNNTMLGLNTNFSTQVPFLTRLINKLPTIETTVPSQISFRGEVASLIAGDPKNTKLEGETNVYLDDFEGAQTNIDVKGAFAWRLASIPFQGFAGATAGIDNLAAGYHRAKLAWYTVDPVFYSTQLRPNGINNDDISLNTTRRIFINEIFPEQDLVQGQSTVQQTLDLAYFPNEKGPYNNEEQARFETNIAQNWGGVMRAINATNFEQSNVEFIEFWLLDTFNEIESEDDQLGELTFHLGNISEDILRDGRKQYENGLPSTELTAVQTTNWGRTPSSQSLLYAFNTIEEDRVLQDVGLDGLNDQEEQAFYSNGPSFDPAGDNYEYFLKRQGGVINRYKNYNGTDGNSPIAFSDSDRGSTAEPDAEDVNRDQTMNTIDSYFEYKIPIQKNMTVGTHPFVTDVRENVNVTLANGQSLTTRWIQFKVPIDKSYYQGTNFSSYFDNVNGIQDLRSIRFMRMLLSGFDQEVVMRFGTLDLVRGDWRRYNRSLNQQVMANANTTVDISTVNILENENRIPVNYILPPEIQREQINNNNTIVRQNEQSLSFRICNLQPMDSRGIYKGVDIDLRQYEKLKMYLHAESIQGQTPLPGSGTRDEYDRRLVAFVRLGTDYQDNYYQIEVPLKPTSYVENSSNRLSAEEVWQPDFNSIDLPIDLLSKIKAAYLENPSFNAPSYFDEELNRINEFDPISDLPGQKRYKLAIKGNPSLGSIKTIMIGVKNPSLDVGDVLCGEVWFNELRIAGIDSQGGWAAIGALDANIADFANLSASGRYSTVGFGSIDQSPNQRSREEMFQYDLVSSVNAGQLLPQKWQVNLPVNYSIGETQITPEYDPFYQDLRLDDRLSVAPTKEARQAIKQQAVDYTKRKSISFIGVRKLGTPEKQRFYNIENFDISYAFNEIKHHDYEIENQSSQNMRLGANYGHTFKPWEINPFKKVKLFNKKQYLRWLKEINLNPVPADISISTNINRFFNSQRFREVYMEGVEASSQIGLPELQQRNFLFDWTYSLNHNLTRSLRLNFSASSNHIVKNYFEETSEGSQRVDKARGIWDGLWDTGDPNRHFQTLNLTYKLPFNYIPFLSFIDANYSYRGDFNWQRGSDVLSEVVHESGAVLGVVNTVQNNNSKTINGSISTNKLYRILGLNKHQKNRSASINRRLSSTDKTTRRSPKKKQKVLMGIVDILTTLKRLQFSYTENNGKVLPGYRPTVGVLGTLQPSAGFTFGSQADVRYEAAKQGWLTDFPDFNQPFTQVHNSQLNLTGQLGLGKGLLIDLNAEKNYSENLSENFTVINKNYLALNSNQYGNFGISTLLIKTAFKRTNDGTSPYFEKFRANRLAIAQRLASKQGLSPDKVDAEGYPIGYGKNQQEVVVPAFLSAYSGTNPNRITLNPIQKVPLPNWNLKYTGLMNLASIKKIFNRFTLTHAYRASYTINQFQTNLDYDPKHPQLKDEGGNFIAEKLYGNLNLVEQFNPLVRIDLELKNSFKLLAELKTDRALSLSLDNNLLTETSGEEYILGMGYRIKDLPFRTSIGGRKRTLKGDLNIKADLSYRNNITVLRNLEIDNNQVTAGQTLWSIKVTADYALSRNLTGLFFYDHNFSKFAISTAFPQTSIRSGISIRYNFGN